MNMGWYHQQMKIVFHKSFGLSYTWHDKLVFWVTNLPKIFIHALKMSVSISRKRDFHLIMFFCPHLDILNNNKRIQVQSNNNKCLFIDLHIFLFLTISKKRPYFWGCQKQKKQHGNWISRLPIYGCTKSIFQNNFHDKNHSWIIGKESWDGKARRQGSLIAQIEELLLAQFQGPELPPRPVMCA